MARRWLIAAAAVVVGGAALWIARRATDGLVVNEVAPGVLVASQPGVGEWRAVIQRLGVRSVINLRGARVSERWYVDELAACRELSVAHEDVRIKLDDWPPQHEVRRYVTLLDTTPRPLLLHCKNGVDRSGWGAAVAILLAGAPFERAIEELSPTTGHICNRATCPLHRFFAHYQVWLSASSVAHSGDAFRRWALEVYCPPPYDAAIAVLTQPLPRRVAPGEPITLRVRVTNRSDQEWTLRPGDQRGIRLGVRAIGPFVAPPEDAMAIFRTPNNPARDLARAGREDGTVPPGGAREFTTGFEAPAETGVYIVQVDMVDEHVHWFSDLGGPGVTFRLDVRQP
jgi:protein tyrosine phosphatase (PTP) superfamily phosphohydrolase (DUF442 family)